MRNHNNFVLGSILQATQRVLPIIASMIFFSIIGTLSTKNANAEPTTGTGIPYITDAAAEKNVIRVGVRADAEPFSYQKPSRADNRILPSYSGYIVEICRTVLRQMATGEIFQEFNIVDVKVTAGNRYEKLANYEVDILCGPDSIPLNA